VSDPNAAAESSQVMSAADIDRALSRIAHEIVEAQRGTQGLIILGIPRRGAPLARRLGANLARIDAPDRLVRRYGTEAAEVLDGVGGDPGLLEPVSEGTEATGAELAFAVRHEGALDTGDLLDRRTRIGLVPGDREAAQPAAEHALEAAPSLR